MPSKWDLSKYTIMHAWASADFLIPQEYINMSGLGTTGVPRPALIHQTSRLAHISPRCRIGSRERNVRWCVGIYFGELWLWFRAESYFVIHSSRTGSINRSLLLDAFSVKDAVELLVLLPYSLCFCFFKFDLQISFLIKSGGDIEPGNPWWISDWILWVLC